MTRDGPMMTNLTPKNVACQCGHIFESAKAKAWCEKCCRPVFYREKDQRRHKISNVYLLTMMAAALMFVTYLFVEMIASPLLSL